jgi:hypothetical protein
VGEREKGAWGKNGKGEGRAKNNLSNQTQFKKQSYDVRNSPKSNLNLKII